jgi:cobyrinic acid a,c-diamide synthase
VVLNRVNSDRHRALLTEALAAIAMPLLGVLPSDPALELPSRHLGLHTPGEINDLEQRIGAWAALAERHLNLECLWPLLAPPGGPEASTDPITSLLPPPAAPPVPLPIAVASDAAFHFRYPEATELLRACGLDPQPWSPLADQPLPADCAAVLLPGGYPELHAAALAASRRSLASLRHAVAAGLPILAECGGLLLLGEELIDADGVPQPMAGVLPFRAAPGALSLGYRQATALADSLVLRRGEVLTGHEFHRWQLQPLAKSASLWQVEGWGSAPRAEGWTTANVHASWLHLHWAGCPVIPWRLAAAARRAGPPPMNDDSSSPPTPAPAPPSANGGGCW